MGKNIKFKKNSKPKNNTECLICGKVSDGRKNFYPCEQCTTTYLQNGVLLVEVIGREEKQEATGRVMVMRDIAFQQVFNQIVPKERIIKVEIGILQRLENHIKENG